MNARAGTKLDAPKHTDLAGGEKLTPYNDITNYNNFCEFATGKYTPPGPVQKFAFAELPNWPSAGGWRSGKCYFFSLVEDGFVSVADLLSGFVSDFFVPLLPPAPDFRA